MTKKTSSVVIPMKINELDRLINMTSCDDLQRGEIEQSLTFVKNLLTAEMASSHPTKHHFFETMLERVRLLEKTYRSGGSSTTASSCVTFDSNHVSNVGYCDTDELASNCSACSELVSTFGQDRGDLIDVEEENKARAMMVFHNELFEEKVDYVLYDNVLYDDGFRNGGSVEEGENVENESRSIRAELDMKESHEKKSNRCLGLVKLCGTVLSGIIIGMFSMVVLGSLEDDAYEQYYGHFLVPT